MHWAIDSVGVSTKSSLSSNCNIILILPSPKRRFLLLALFCAAYSYLQQYNKWNASIVRDEGKASVAVECEPYLRSPLLLS